MVRYALLLALLASCYRDRYRCESDNQCDVEGGRCEVDGFCTAFDDSCPTSRRYQHAGELSDTCFDDRIALANPCAGGQRAARPDDECIQNVCERLPACCGIAWTDACAQLAQQECDTRCDTRIALTATRATVTESWDVHWIDDHFEIAPIADPAPPLQWVAPPPGEVEPRLAGIRGDQLVVGALAFEIDPRRAYQSITTIPFARDTFDTIAASSNLDGDDDVIEILVPDGERRVIPAPSSQNLTWGDIDHSDGFPDAIVRSGGQYSYLQNLDATDHVRDLEARVLAQVQGGATPGAPNFRQVDWVDLDNDTAMDFVVFGTEVRVHRNPNGLDDTAEHQIDCDPPSAQRTCMTDPEPNLEQASFGGAALPDRELPSLVISLFPGRRLFRASLVNDAIELVPLPFPGDTCSCIERCSMQTCPGPDCTCTYDCAACVPVIAVIVRDLDGDRRLDLIAIDARLAVYHAFAPDFAWSAPVQIPTAITGNLAQIATSVTGAPL